MSKHWAMALLLLQLAFFGGWAWREEQRLVLEAFLLETEGVDPRDLFAGQYLTLAYPAARLPKSESSQEDSRWSEYAVKLDAAGDTVVAGKRYPLRRAKHWERVDYGKSLGSGEREDYSAKKGWVRGHTENGRVKFGIERYYFNEARAEELNQLRPGSYYVLVTLGQDGTLRIRDLIYEKAKP